MELTAGERLALENLSRKSRGEEVGWINIADARALADKGLAARDRQGWVISPDGVAWLSNAPAAPVKVKAAAPLMLNSTPFHDPSSS